jgi:putative phosphoribosyl transferase
VAGRDVIVVDDGLATGTTARAALQTLRRRHPAHLVLAVPVAPSDTIRALEPMVDEVVCLAIPEPFRAIGLHYRDFHQLEDAEVLRILSSVQAEGAPPRAV